MEYVKAILSLLAGLGAFLLGFSFLSENIEKLANTKLKKLFNKTSKNRFVGVGIGALVTAIIQSSSAATVMIVGFVNAGVMNLFQATAMIMGANIGTTITAQIVALNSFDVGAYLAVLAFIGVFGAMICKKEKTKTLFLSLAGLGLVFLALDFMSLSMNIFKESDTFIHILGSINNPFLLLLIGIVLTAILQSSSAVTTILISMVTAGLMIGSGGNSILYVILGSNIGTCVTALLSSIGASTNARRASIIHLMFNLFAATIFFILLLCIPSFMDNTFVKWFSGAPATQIAMFHTFFNVTATLFFLPFIQGFVKISKWIIKDKKEEVHTTFLDDRFLKNTAIALDQTSKEIIQYGVLSMNILNRSIDSFLQNSLKDEEEMRKEIHRLEKINDSILNYLIKVNANDITIEDEKYISSLHRIMIDFSREVEIADNMIKYTSQRQKEELTFSDTVIEGISQMKEKLNSQFMNIQKLFEKKDKKVLKNVTILEEQIDQQRKELIQGHIRRLEEGKCSPKSNSVFISLVSNLERAGDHLDYVAHILME